MKVVSPYRRIEPYTRFHRDLHSEGFDWIAALRMLRRSVWKTNGVETFAITCDKLPVPIYRYPTTEPRLMFWLLEVSLAYIESRDFDEDTVCLFPDTLALDRLDIFGDFDVAFCARASEKTASTFPLLNGAQWWALEARDRLVWLFRECLSLAETLPRNEQEWGADTKPLVQLLGPVSEGLWNRNGIRVRFLHPSTMTTVTETLMRKGRMEGVRVVDFKGYAKRRMRAYFERVFE